MNIFVAASYSSKVNYETGEVFPEYEHELESHLTRLEDFGHNVFCALRADHYKINDADPAQAFQLDLDEIEKADGMFAIVDSKASAGVQTEIGIAIGLQKRIILARAAFDKLAYFNDAIIRSGKADEVLLPIESDPFFRIV
ncbi:MAG: hypothetical protein EOO17_04280 [Chloroflexi bacterium]|nr:MAG: hypothetical protein EOO17_04280 [Chloroflexota bacterium]